MEYWGPNTKSNTAPLTDSELESAVQELSVNAKHPKVNRRFIDPPVTGEPQFALFSFIPTKGAKPDEHGFFGFAKIRGCYTTPDAAKDRAQDIIRDVDSTNSIFTCKVGLPIPVCSTRGDYEEVDEVDIRKKTEQTISDNVRAKRVQDQKEMDEIRDREEALKADVSAGPDPQEDYITNRVKLANLKFVIAEHKKKREECEELLDKCISWLKEAKAENPEFEEQYMDRYMESRRKANIPDDASMGGFMDYMQDPLPE